MGFCTVMKALFGGANVECVNSEEHAIRGTWLAFELLSFIIDRIVVGARFGIPRLVATTPRRARSSVSVLELV